MWAWQAQLPALAASRRAIVFDNRGSGRSLKPPGPYSVDRLADDAAAVVRAVVGDRAVHVAGLSMGGYVAQTLALREPGLVRSLTLLSTAVGGRDTVPVPEETVRLWSASARRPASDYARATMWVSFAPGWSDDNREEYERLLAARLEYPTPPEGWAAQYAACAEFLARESPVEEIAVPALVVHGDADRVVPVENGRALAARLRDARYCELRGRGHLALLEAPDEVNRELLVFLDEVEVR